MENHCPGGSLPPTSGESGLTTCHNTLSTPPPSYASPHPTLEDLPVIIGNLGFHLSSSMSPSRDTLSRNKGRREVEDSSLEGRTHVEQGWRVQAVQSRRLISPGRTQQLIVFQHWEGCHVTVLFRDLAWQLGLLVSKVVLHHSIVGLSLQASFLRVSVSSQGHRYLVHGLGPGKFRIFFSIRLRFSQHHNNMIITKKNPATAFLHSVTPRVTC